VEGQLKDSEARQLAYPGKGTAKPAFDQSRLPQPAKKNLS
jgi:hypothetical protein